MSGNKIPGWKIANCPECKEKDIYIGRPAVGFLGATPSDSPQRFLLDVTERCANCLASLGLNRRNYGVPGLECENMVEGVERALPILKRKSDERWNYRAERGDLDPDTFKPMRKRAVRGDTATKIPLLAKDLRPGDLICYEDVGPFPVISVFTEIWFTRSSKDVHTYEGAHISRPTLKANMWVRRKNDARVVRIGEVRPELLIFDALISKREGREGEISIQPAGLSRRPGEWFPVVDPVEPVEAAAQGSCAIPESKDKTEITVGDWVRHIDNSQLRRRVGRVYFNQLVFDMEETAFGTTRSVFYGVNPKFWVLSEPPEINYKTLAKEGQLQITRLEVIEKNLTRNLSTELEKTKSLREELQKIYSSRTALKEEIYKLRHKVADSDKKLDEQRFEFDQLRCEKNHLHDLIPRLDKRISEQATEIIQLRREIENRMQEKRPQLRVQM